MSGRLYVCPTPIGNLADITLRAVQVLGEVDGIACEDTRRTGRLLAHHGIPKPALIPFHDRNEAAMVPVLLRRLQEGESLALVSDAGTPLVSDPGFKLVRACREGGIPVEVLPGPTAITTALIAAAIPCERFCFLGFLPRGAQRAAELLAAHQGTAVAFDSPQRVAATVAGLALRQPDRPIALCRELTKLHEEVIRGRARDVAEALQDRRIKGEVVLVVGPPDPGQSPSAS
jgi:16S rRNA (cytidine1402-2'-O)-methyltransferase